MNEEYWKEVINQMAGRISNLSIEAATTMASNKQLKTMLDEKENELKQLKGELAALKAQVQEVNNVENVQEITVPKQS